MRLKFEIQISRPRGCQEPDTQVASLGCTHYSRALAPLAFAAISTELMFQIDIPKLEKSNSD